MSVILSVVCFDKAQHRLKLANLIKVPELVEGSNEKKSCIDAGFFSLFKQDCLLNCSEQRL